MRQNSTRRTLLAGIGAAAATTAAGAGSIVATDRVTASADDDQSARVRVAHASPDAPAVDVLVEGDTVLSGVSFRSVTEYLSLEPGEYEVTITAADDPETVALEGTVSVEAGTDYTVAAIGELSEESFRAEVLVDRNRELPRDVVEVRVVHASPDAPAVDVTTEHGRELAKGLSFGNVGHYEVLFGGETKLAVRPAGDEVADPVFEGMLTLEGGNTYTVFAEGYLTPEDEPTDEPFGLVPAAGGPRPESARIRALHASPDAPNVDVLVDSEKAFSKVHFGTVTEYLTLEEGSYEVTVTAAGDPETVVFEGTASVEAGTDYTVAAIGELSEGTIRPEVLLDEADIDAGTAGVRVLHASPDAPAVDVTTAETGSTLVDDLSFGETTGVAGIDPGRYTLEVRPASSGDDNPFDAEFGVRLRPGRLYTLVAAGYFTADDEPGDSQFTLVPAVTETGRDD